MSIKIKATKPIKNPKKLTHDDKARIKTILKENKHLLTKTEKRIYKEELKDV